MAVTMSATYEAAVAAQPVVDRDRQGAAEVRSVEKGGESTNFDKAVLGSQVEAALVQGHFRSTLETSARRPHGDQSATGHVVEVEHRELGRGGEAEVHPCGSDDGEGGELSIARVRS